MQKTETVTDYKTLIVTSKAFEPNGPIPARYTCDGEDINPPIDVTDIPPESKSLVFIIDDPDAPAGTWLHWLLWNIPVTHHIRENEVPGVEGMNDFGRVAYGGPCPPSGTHRYFFRIYALDDLLDLTEGAERKEVESAMRDHIVAYGELVGTYSHTKPRQARQKKT